MERKHLLSALLAIILSSANQTKVYNIVTKSMSLLTAIVLLVMLNNAISKPVNGKKSLAGTHQMVA